MGDLASAGRMYWLAMDSRHGEYAAMAAFNLGNALAGQGDVNGAVWAYRGAIGCADPQHSPKAATNLGRLLEERGDSTGAIAAYQQVPIQTEHSAEAAFRLGMLLDSQGDTEAAQSAYRRGVDATDSRYQPLCAINLGALLAGQGDHSGAAEMYRRALKSPHGDNAALAACNLGHASARQGDQESAAAAFRQAIDFRHAEHSPRAAMALGDLLEAGGDAAGALGAYQRVLDFDDEKCTAEARNRLQRLRVAPAQDPTSAVHDAVMRWAATNIEEGKDRHHASLAGAIRQLQSECCEVKVKLSAGQSRSGRPMYGFSWLDEFHAFELSAEQARQLGIEPDAVTIQGIGGAPRGDTRQSPAVRIEGLRVNNGGPVTSNSAISVAVQCDPNNRLAADVRLRIGYVLTATSMVFSPPIGDIPPDGLLSKELRPFAEADWTEGPVPIFVDLVVLHENNDELRFTAVSNTLTALLDVARASGAPRHHDLATDAARWLGSVFVDGPDARMITSLGESIDGILQGGSHFKMLVPAEFTTTGTDYYGFSCAGGFFPLAMTRTQAEAAGVKSDGVVLGGTFSVDAGARPHLAQLRDLQLRASGSADAEIPGTVVATFDQPPPPNLMLRMSRLYDNSSSVALKPVTEPTSDGVLAFTLYPRSGDEPRGPIPLAPIPLAVDLCVNEGSQTSPRLTSVSNTLVTLVERPSAKLPWSSLVASDLFSWFHMSELGREALDRGRTWIGVAPGAFQEFIGLRFAVDDHDDVVAFSLRLDRRWLDSPGLGMSNGGDLAKSVIASVAACDAFLEDVSHQVERAALIRAGAIVAGPLADPTSHPGIAALVNTFLNPGAGSATVHGSGVITAQNVGAQAATWLTIEWSLTGPPDW